MTEAATAAAAAQTTTDAPATATTDTTAPAPAAAPASDAATQQTPAPATAQTTAADPAAGTEGEPKASDSYADFTMPEGKNLPADLVTDIKELAKAQGLTQEQAQQMADLALKRQELGNTQFKELLDKQSNDWTEASKADKEFGGDKLDENIAIAKKAMDQFGSPELRDLLVQTRLGNHPDVIRMFVKIGKQISQDTIVSGRGSESGESQAQRGAGISMSKYGDALYRKPA